jgi:hypothetical protein
MFLFEITVKAAQLFPFNDRQCCIEHVQIGYLDIGDIYVVTLTCLE